MAEIIAYTDLNLDFYPHPLTGNVYAKTNIEAIRQAVKTLFLLEPYDIPFNPDLHSNIKNYLFEPIISATTSNIKKRAEWLINTYEKRISLISIEIIPNDTENRIRTNHNLQNKCTKR